MLVRSIWRIAIIGLVWRAPAALAERGSSDHDRLFVSGDLSSDNNGGLELLAGTLKTGLFGNSEVTVVTADLVGDFFVSPNLKLHARLPTIYYANDNNNEGGTGIGNVTAGLRFIAAGRDKSSRFGLGGSVSLPSASDDGEGGAAAFYGGVFRNLHDPGRYLPNVTTIRTEADLLLSSDRIYVQGQLGVQVLLFEDGNAFPFGGDDQQNLLRLCVGGGAWLAPKLALLAEVTSFSDILENDDDDDFVHTLDTGVRYHGGDVSASVRLYVPFDEGERTEDAVGAGFDLTARF